MDSAQTSTVFLTKSNCTETTDEKQTRFSGPSSGALRENKSKRNFTKDIINIVGERREWWIDVLWETNWNTNTHTHAYAQPKWNFFSSMFEWHHDDSQNIVIYNHNHTLRYSFIFSTFFGIKIFRKSYMNSVQTFYSVPFAFTMLIDIDVYARNDVLLN